MNGKPAGLVYTTHAGRQAVIALIHSLYPSAPFMRMNHERWREKYKSYIEIEKALERLPSAQPERLTDDDFETIRIHLSAFKEQLCNQHRWKEAEKYQRTIDRFMAFAHAQTEGCEGCQHLKKWENEVERGYLSPCTLCKRGARDYYER